MCKCACRVYNGRDVAHADLYYFSHINASVLRVQGIEMRFERIFSMKRIQLLSKDYETISKPEAYFRASKYPDVMVSLSNNESIKTCFETYFETSASQCVGSGGKCVFVVWRYKPANFLNKRCGQDDLSLNDDRTFDREDETSWLTYIARDLSEFKFAIVFENADVPGYGHQASLEEAPFGEVASVSIYVTCFTCDSNSVVIKKTTSVWVNSKTTVHPSPDVADDRHVRAHARRFCTDCPILTVYPYDFLNPDRRSKNSRSSRVASREGAVLLFIR